MRHKHHRFAVTLFELMVVLTIIAILGAMAIPRLSNVMRRERLAETARQVANDIGATRAAALRTKQKYSITFENDLQQYRIGKFDRGPTDPQRVVSLSSESGAAARLEQAEFCGSNELVFDRLGVPVQAGYIYLAGDNETAMLTVSPTTGRVTMTYQDTTATDSETSPDPDPSDEQPDQTG